MKEYTNDECGVRRMGEQRRKWSEWWSDDVGMVLAIKRGAFQKWLHRRYWVTYDRYRALKPVVKQTVRIVKLMADWRWEERLGNDFECNKNMFGER